MLTFLDQTIYAIELLLAETVFCYCFPKRKFFAFRLAASSVVLLAMCSLVMTKFGKNDGLPAFFGGLAIIAGSILCMYVSYRMRAIEVIATSVAGVAIQHIAYHLYMLLLMNPWIPIEHSSPLDLLVGCVFYFIVWLFLGRKLARDRYTIQENPFLAGVGVVIISICIGLMRLYRVSHVENTLATVAMSCYAITCCLLALFILFSVERMLRLKNDMLHMKHLHQMEMEQYAINRENDEQLKLKYHDLKHKLISLQSRLPQEEMDSMMELLDQYDGIYHTGLEVLDIILNEKQRRCAARHIGLTVMGDGKDISFMQEMDVYSLFGNILDNAIEAAEQLSDPEKRTISLVINRKGDLVHISIYNFKEVYLELQPSGLPYTTKTGDRDFHGYGLKSVQAIAEKYEGHIDIRLESDIFGLNIFMNCPNNDPE